MIKLPVAIAKSHTAMISLTVIGSTPLIYLMIDQGANRSRKYITTFLYLRQYVFLMIEVSEHPSLFYTINSFQLSFLCRLTQDYSKI